MAEKQQEHPYTEALTAADRLRSFIETRYGGQLRTVVTDAELRDLRRAIDALMAVLPDEQQ